jgi:hypothetical protein
MSAAATAVTDTAASAAGSVGLTEMSGKTAAAIAGGTLAAAGVTAMLMSGNKDDDDDKSADKKKLSAKELDELRMRIFRAEQEAMKNGDQLPPMQNDPKGRGV